MENLYKKSVIISKFRKRKSVLDNFFYNLRKFYKYIGNNTACKGFVFCSKNLFSTRYIRYNLPKYNTSYRKYKYKFAGKICIMNEFMHIRKRNIYTMSDNPKDIYKESKFLPNKIGGKK